jgi:hypothetical protein
MANNLVSLVMQFLTPDVIGRIAAALGLDRNKAQTAIGAAVPGLLAALGGVATQPGGAQKLADAARQQTSTLEDLSRILGTGEHGSLVDKGSQMLSSLLGPDKDAIAGAVSKFAGVGQGGVASLLGMLAPAVMRTIAGQQGGRSLDASGIASLLAGQKDNIAAALPAGFGKLLAGTGLLDSLGGAALSGATKAATSAASQTVQAASAASRGLADSAQRASSSSPNWRYWVIPLLVVAAAVIYFLSRSTEQAVKEAATTAQTLTVGGVDIGKQVDDSIGSLRTSLGSVTDAVSAKAALPKMQEVTADIDKVGGMIAQLSPDQRKLLAGLVNPATPALNQLFDKVLATPGASEVLKPTIDALKAKLATLTA